MVVYLGRMNFIIISEIYLNYVKERRETKIEFSLRNRKKALALYFSFPNAENVFPLVKESLTIFEIVYIFMLECSTFMRKLESASDRERGKKENFNFFVPRRFACCCLFGDMI